LNWHRVAADVLPFLERQQDADLLNLNDLLKLLGRQT
jgi:hypothetical protein